MSTLQAVNYNSNNYSSHGWQSNDITMTYTHTTTVYPWESGVENINQIIGLDSGIYTEADLAMDIGEHGEIAIAYARNSTGPVNDGTKSLGLLYKLIPGQIPFSTTHRYWFITILGNRPKWGNSRYLH